jgi:hypothetical protein
MIALAVPEPEEPRAPTSYELCFSFRDRSGQERRGRTWIGWQRELQARQAGDAVPICYNPARPQENIALWALVSCQPQEVA